MKMEQCAPLLGIDDPFFRIIEIVGIQKPNCLGSGDDSFHQHPAAKVKMTLAKGDDIDDVSDRYTPLAKVVAA